MATLDELSAYLATELSLAVGTTIFKHTLPATPDVVLVVRGSGGSPSVLALGREGIQFEYPSVQVVSRGAPKDYATAQSRAESAYRALAKIQAESLSGTPYLIVRPLNPPSDVLGEDEKLRPRVSFNILIEKELSV